jgi:hypothetical protein
MPFYITIRDQRKHMDVTVSVEIHNLPQVKWKIDAYVEESTTNDSREKICNLLNYIFDCIQKIPEIEMTGN